MCGRYQRNGQSQPARNTTDYKVYWEDGAQITPPHDTGIMGEVKKRISDWNTVKTMDKGRSSEGRSFSK